MQLYSTKKGKQKASVEDRKKEKARRVPPDGASQKSTRGITCQLVT